MLISISWGCSWPAIVPGPIALWKKKPSGAQHQGTSADLRGLCWWVLTFKTFMWGCSSGMVTCQRHQSAVGLDFVINVPLAEPSVKTGIYKHAEAWLLIWAFLCDVSFPCCSPKGRRIGTSPATFLIVLCSLSSFSTESPRDLNTPEFKRWPQSAQNTQPFWPWEQPFPFYKAYGFWWNPVTNIRMHFNQVLCGLWIPL